MNFLRRLRILLPLLMSCWLVFAACSSLAAASTDPERANALPSWKGPVRDRMVDFIFDVSTPGNPDFIPPRDRIAVTDMDGTLLTEKPTYFVFDVAIHYMNEHFEEISAKGPQYKALCEAARDHDYQYLRKRIDDTFVLPFEGKTFSFFREYARNLFEKLIHPTMNRPLRELVYKPMVELIDLLHERDFTVYVVSGSMQFCIMAISEKYFHVDQSRCIGSMVQATARREGDRTVFVRGALQPPPNLQEGKAIRIMMRAGRPPVLAIGNSGGDAWMLQFPENSPHRTLSAVMHHDHPEEFLYSKDTLLTLAKQKGWAIISMKDTFRTLYGPGE